LKKKQNQQRKRAIALISKEQKNHYRGLSRRTNNGKNVATIKKKKELERGTGYKTLDK